jgi:periplasmic protein TonB
MGSVTMKDAAEPGRAMSLEMPSRSTETPSAGPDSAPPAPARGGGRVPVSGSGYTLLHLDDATADGTAFGERKSRFGGALGTSVGTHVLFILLFWGLTLLPVPAPVPMEEKPFDPSQLVWANVPGPGGGGGGGGNQMKEPPAQMQTKPIDKIAVPIAKPTPQTPPKEIPKQTPELTVALNVPVKPMDAGAIAQVGTIDAPSAPTVSQGSGVGGGSGTGSGTGSGPGRGSGLGDGEGGGTGGGAYQIGNGVLPPELIHRTSPQYTAEAMRAKIQGVSLLSGIVGVDGTLQDIRVSRSLDGTFGLDQEAIKCVRQWRFRPGTRQGRAVPVYVTIEVAFNLR